MNKILTVQQLWDAFVNAGIFSEQDAGMIRRIVIDVDVDKVGVIMHVERWASPQILRVIPRLEGVEIRWSERESVEA